MPQQIDQRSSATSDPVHIDYMVFMIFFHTKGPTKSTSVPVQREYMVIIIVFPWSGSARGLVQPKVQFSQSCGSKKKRAAITSGYHYITKIPLLNKHTATKQAFRDHTQDHDQSFLNPNRDQTRIPPLNWDIAIKLGYRY